MAKHKGSGGKSANTQAAAKQSAGTVEAVAVAATSTPAPAQPSKGATATLSRKEMLREAALRKQRKQNLYLAIGGVIVALIVVAIGYAIYRNSLPVVGETTFPTQGNLHIPEGTNHTAAYNSTPPTSGQHYPNLAPWGVQDQDIRYEYLVHNLEDAGVVVYYQCDGDCTDLVNQLQAVLKPYIDSGRHVVLTRNDPNWVENGVHMHQDMGAKIALAAWQKLKLMNEVDPDTIKSFIDKYEGIDHHQAGIG